MNATIRRIAFLAVLSSLDGPDLAAQCELAQITPFAGTSGSQFGGALAFDTATIVVGAQSADGIAVGTGAAYVYVDALGTWTQQAQLFASAGVSNDHFGVTVGLEGNVAVIGAPNVLGLTGIHQGAAYVFTRNTIGAWSETQMITANDPNANDEFGIAVGISGGTIVIGSHNDDTSGPLTGSAYVFVESSGAWVQQAKLAAADGMQDDHFGEAVAISGDTVVVGVSRHAANGPFSGAAYVFTRSGTTWTQQAKLVPSDGVADDEFGKSVAIDGDVAIVGAPGRANDTGAAYVFRRSGTTWSEEARLTAWNGVKADLFGGAVAVESDLVAVGATKSDGAAVNSGSAYAYRRVLGEWRDVAWATAANAGSGDELGASVFVSGGLVAAGGRWWDAMPTQNVGEVRVFNPISFGESYGAGCPGTGGVTPTLRVLGCPSGAEFTLRIDRGLGPSFGVLLYGATAAATPIAGACTLHVAPLLPVTSAFQLAGFGPGIGSFAVTLSLPPSVPSGSLTMQAAIFDPFGAPGYTVSNGVEVTLP